MTYNRKNRKPLTIAQAVRHANLFERAKAMAEQGYRFKQFYQCVNAWCIFKPGNDSEKHGYRDYFVQRNPSPSNPYFSCSCPDYAEFKDTCKHCMFVEHSLKEQEEAAQQNFEELLAEWTLRAEYEQ